VIWENSLTRDVSVARRRQLKLSRIRNTWAIAGQQPAYTSRKNKRTLEAVFYIRSVQRLCDEDQRDFKTLRSLERTKIWSWTRRKPIPKTINLGRAISNLLSGLKASQLPPWACCEPAASQRGRDHGSGGLSVVCGSLRDNDWWRQKNWCVLQYSDSSSA
jgi:hypothetical protein